MTKSCIINVGCGGWYPRGTDRLEASLRQVGYQGDLLLYRDRLPPGSPSHAQVPYAFKIHAIQEAARLGYDLVLWCDSSMHAIAHPAPLFEKIREVGHLFVGDPNVVGNWSTDAFLRHWGLTRDEAMLIPMFSAGFTGLDLANPVSRVFLDVWSAASQDGVSFHGPWNNNDKSISQDERCRGHRHDMSTASLLAYRMGMAIQPNGMYFNYAYEPYDREALCVCFETHGM